MQSKKERNKPWCPMCKPSVQFEHHAALFAHMKGVHQSKLFPEKTANIPGTSFPRQDDGGYGD